jgi:hypothetical protein
VAVGLELQRHGQALLAAQVAVVQALGTLLAQELQGKGTLAVLVVTTLLVAVIAAVAVALVGREQTQLLVM